MKDQNERDKERRENKSNGTHIIILQKNSDSSKHVAFEFQTSSVTNIAWPICNEPVTLGGGIGITNGSPPLSKLGLKKSWDSHLIEIINIEIQYHLNRDKSEVMMNKTQKSSFT